MEAVILAAGRGSRLGELTRDGPKCLVQVHGMALIDRQIQSLTRAGIHSVTVVTGYAGDRLSKYGSARIKNPNWSDTGIVQSLLCADKILTSGPVVISYSDIFYTTSTVERLMACPEGVAISYDLAWMDIWQRRFEAPLSDAETFSIDPQGRLLEIGGEITGPVLPSGQFMGLLKTTPLGWRELKFVLSQMEPSQTSRIDMTGLLRCAIAQGVSVKATPNVGPWGEVDHASDIDVYERLYPKL